MPPKRLLYCWELGQGYGHVLNFRRLALKLLAEGWQISCVVSHVKTMRQMLPEITEIVAAPRMNKQRRFSPTRNLAEILYNNGYHHRAEIGRRVGLWRELFEHFQPDIVLLDHAPTALIAAHLNRLPHAILGTGFFLPPDQSPLPDLQSDMRPPSEAEHQLLGSINDLMAAAQLPLFPYLSALFYQAQQHFLCTFPEFDHYANRQGAAYWGASFDLAQGVIKQWPKSATQRIFAYLHADYPAIDRLLAGLDQLPATVLVHVGGQYLWQPQRYQNLLYSPEPVRMTEVAAQADLVICHAGHGTISAMLLAGKPLLLLPKQLEQMLLAMRLCQQHLAYFVPPGATFTHLPQLIAKIAADLDLKLAVDRFKLRYQGYDQDEQAEGMFDALADMLVEKTLA